jgi:acyl carrier protein
MLATLLDIVADVTEVERADLRPNDVVSQVGIDSLGISQVLVEVEIELAVEFDYDQLPDDWSELTLEELAQAMVGSIF